MRSAAASPAHTASDPGTSLPDQPSGNQRACLVGQAGSVMGGGGNRHQEFAAYSVIASRSAFNELCSASRGKDRGVAAIKQEENA